MLAVKTCGTPRWRTSAAAGPGPGSTARALHALAPRCQDRRGRCVAPSAASASDSEQKVATSDAADDVLGMLAETLGGLVEEGSDDTPGQPVPPDVALLLGRLLSRSGAGPAPLQGNCHVQCIVSCLMLRVRERLSLQAAVLEHARHASTPRGGQRDLAPNSLLYARLAGIHRLLLPELRPFNGSFIGSSGR